MLLAGVLIGQLDIAISPSVKSVFFLMFLFATGYDVGPQFVRGLKRDGLPQVLFACCSCASPCSCPPTSPPAWPGTMRASRPDFSPPPLHQLGGARGGDRHHQRARSPVGPRESVDRRHARRLRSHLPLRDGRFGVVPGVHRRAPGSSASISSRSARTTSEGWADRRPRRVGSAPTPRWRSARARSRRIRSSWASASRTSRRASRSPGSPPSSTPSGGGGMAIS